MFKKIAAFVQQCVRRVRIATLSDEQQNEMLANLAMSESERCRTMVGTNKGVAYLPFACDYESHRDYYINATLRRRCEDANDIVTDFVCEYSDELGRYILGVTVETSQEYACELALFVVLATLVATPTAYDYDADECVLGAAD